MKDGETSGDRPPQRLPLPVLIHVSSGGHVEGFSCYEIILQQKHNRMRKKCFEKGPMPSNRDFG